MRQLGVRSENQNSNETADIVENVASVGDVIYRSSK